MVSLGHLNNFSSVEIPLNYISMFGGKTAVMVFLMISGISVGYSFEKNDKGFLKRRFFRIYPLYFVAVLGTIILQYYLGSPYHVNNMDFAAAGDITNFSNFLLLQGIAVINISYNSPVWSLSVEAFLYLILPLISKIRLCYVYLIALISLIIYTFHLHFSISLYGVQHVMYAWPFILGYLIAVKKQLWYTVPLILIGVYSIYYNYLIGLVFEKYSFICFLSAVMIVVFTLYLKMHLSKKTIIFFNFLGTISYPMYLVHIPLYLLLYHLGIRESYIFVCLVILFSIPFNYICDVWLKKIFWKPMVAKAESLYTIIIVKLQQPIKA
jgi:peptidoglycan/LPS O-acetylase OafA/YrhL